MDIWQPFLWLALLVALARWLLRRRSGGGLGGPLTNVGDAPADAEPIAQPRLDDNGLATYSMVLQDDHRRASRRTRRTPAPVPSEWDRPGPPGLAGRPEARELG